MCDICWTRCLWRLSVRMIAEQLGKDKVVVQKIINEDLGMRKICAKRFKGRLEIYANWNLHHDNAPPHTCFVVTEHLTKNGIVTIPRPPLQPRLCPSRLFPLPQRENRPQRAPPRDPVIY
ncbi:uncharacterized protein TNCV_2751101 [Trichonephila clavipes]|uniref:Transposase n=1 Tax=Trichonephila clavipes TaxID=2585209 RepID=A0A8X6WJL5_TRICX|nr:uncharacterized protein TNCV_2751101 [Trichonephila clavipes]